MLSSISPGSTGLSIKPAMYVSIALLTAGGGPSPATDLGVGTVWLRIDARGCTCLFPAASPPERRDSILAFLVFMAGKIGGRDMVARKASSIGPSEKT